jgi:hypothetical protein
MRLFKNINDVLHFAPAQIRCAKGALSLLAWGSAPGFMK